MVDSEESKPPKLLWVDRWLAVRWRALLAWVAFAGLSCLVNGIWWWQQIVPAIVDLTEMIESAIPAAIPPAEAVAKQLLRFSASQWPPAVSSVYIAGPLASLALLFSWHEPLLLRLNPLRSVAWLGVRIGTFFVWGVVYDQRPYNSWFQAGFSLLPPVALMAVLWGWRSRPWMCVVSGVLSFGFFRCADLLPVEILAWPYLVMGTAIICAAVLLYGTRLLRPEERARRSNERPSPGVPG